MKYLFTPLLVLLLCTCGRAQDVVVQLEEKPGSPDSLRWLYYQTDELGNVQVITTPYDTKANVIEFGRAVYTQGGFIGQGRIPSPNQYYTESVRNFHKGVPSYASQYRQDLAETMGDVAGYDPMSQDSSLCYDLVGEWLAVGYFCGMPSDTLTVEMYDGALGRQMRAYPKGTTPDANSRVSYIADGVALIFSPLGITRYPMIRQDSTRWQAVLGCTFIKVPE